VRHGGRDGWRERERGGFVGMELERMHIGVLNVHFTLGFGYDSIFSPRSYHV